MTSDTFVDIDFAGESLRLLPDKALLWPAARMLMVADTHFGKGEVFRRHGIAVPAGSTASSMQRINRLLEQHSAEKIVVLGDFLHGKPSEALIEKIAEWSKTLTAELVVLRGNHDRHLAEKPTQWRHITMQAELQQQRLTLQHEPATEDPGMNDFSGNIICGHIHPVARLGNSRHDRLRMPVFWQQRGTGGEQLVLPSFGSFTGGFRITPAHGTRLYLAGDDQVVAI